MKIDKIFTLDCLAFVAIGLYCFLVSLFGPDFAKMALHLPFLKFPIFVGEQLFLLMLLFLIIKLCLTRRVGPIELAWGVYLLWVIVEALAGYASWGPYALRNAALFYYACFAFFGYAFYNQQISANKKILFVVFLMLIVLLGLNLMKSYFWYTCFILTMVLILKIFSSPWRFFVIALVLIICHLENLFIGSRAHMIGIFGAVLFLVFVNRSLLYKISFKMRLCLIAVFFVIFAVGVIKLSDRNSIKSLSDWSKVSKRYDAERQIVLKKKDSFYLKTRACNLYNPNENSFRDPAPELALFHFTLNHKSPSKKDLEEAPAPNIPAQLPQKSAMPQQAQAMPVQVSEEKSTVPQQAQAMSVQVSEEKSTVPQQARAMPVQVSEEKSAVPQRPPAMPVQPPEHSLQMTPSTQTISRPAALDDRNLDVAYNNILFRLFIWEDMFNELWSQQKFFGVGLGQPQRSPSVEILGWGSSEWMRDGWITPHNFFFHVIYRTGIIGVLLLLVFIVSFVYLIRVFMDKKDMCGLLLLSILVYWCLQSAFSVTLELPYYAILFWSLFGMIFAYARHLGRGNDPVKN